MENQPEPLSTAAEQILGAAEKTPENSTDFDKMLAGAAAFSKNFEIQSAVLIVAAKGQAPIVLGTGKDLTTSYALVVAAGNGLHHAVVTKACGGEEEAQHV